MTGERIDLGHGHALEFVTLPALGDEPEIPEYAANYFHPRPDGTSECRGYIVLHRSPDGLAPRWDVISREPLTLSPSLLCSFCGDHGFIREGKWVPA